jgi:flavin-dependent dehydrogenase
VVVIGGSQAGLAMAWHLARHHVRFVLLEAGPEIGLRGSVRPQAVHSARFAQGVTFSKSSLDPVRKPAETAVVKINSC